MMDEIGTNDDDLDAVEHQGDETGDLPLITLKSRGVSVEIDDVPRHAGAGDPFTPAPHPDEPFLERHKWWVLGAAVATALLAAALVLVLFFSDSSKSQAVEVLISPARRVDAIDADVGNTASIAGFNRIGDRVGRVQAALSSARQQAQLIGNDEVRAATLGLLAAEDSLMTTFDDLAAINRPKSSAAKSIVDDAKDREREIKSAIARLNEIGLEVTPSPYPSERELNRAVDSLRDQLGG